MCASAAAAVLLLATLSTPAAARDPFSLPVEESRLPNGLRVILAPDHGVPGVAVDVLFAVGSGDERPGRTGFAHLFEHLMFMGSVHAPYPQFDALMERHGGRNNASTGEDRTHYFEEGPSNLLPLFLWLEADRMATLPQVMTAEKVWAQRLVVQNERRQSYENRPYGVAALALPPALFPPHHPYSWPVIGNHADLEAATAEEVKAFFALHYTPSSASLAIAGDFDPAEALSLVRRYFGWMAAAPVPPRPRAIPGPPPAAAPVRLRDRVSLPLALLAWRSPPAFAPGDAEMDLAARVLVNGKSGRLYRRLVYEKRMATEVEADQESLELGSVFRVSALARPGRGSDALAAEVEGEMRRLAAEGPTPAEVEEARTVILTRLAKDLERLDGRAAFLNVVARGLGRADALPRAAARYREATPESIRLALQGVLAGGRASLDVEPLPGDGGAR